MDEKREKRKINCGTEKGKHKSKNHRTVGKTTFKTKVLIINADTEKGLVYGFSLWFSTITTLFRKYLEL